MAQAETHLIDLTGPQSHALVREPGVGRHIIAPPSLGKKANLHVAADQPINWTVFNAFTVPAGYPWPRVLDYTGADTGFFAWARQRPIEDVDWTPIFAADSHERELAVDASASRIGILIINMTSPGGRLRLTLPKREQSPHLRLTVTGDIARFSADGEMPRSVAFTPRTGSRKTNGSYQLPDIGALHQVSELELYNQPMGQPISLQCLGRFPNLESLSLYGSFSDLDALAECNLESLQLRFIPDLDGLPALSTWPKLDYFIAWNVEQAAGKRLRKEIKARAAIRPWSKFVSVSQLRKPEWWASEFGRPFSAWPGRRARLANTAYDAALAALAQARSMTDAETAFTTFVARFNTIKGIETTERDDLGDAVWQLSQSDDATRLGVTEEMAQRWFDEVRDY